MRLTVLVVLALTWACAARSSAPRNISTVVLDGDMTPFQMLRIQPGSNLGTALMTLQSLVSLPGGGGKPVVQAIPADASSHVAIAAAVPGSVDVIRLVPVANADTFVTYECSSSSNYVFSCQFHSPVDVLQLPAADEWRDIVYNGANMYLLFADTYFVTISCPGVKCSVVKASTALNNPNGFPNLLQVAVPSADEEIVNFLVLLGRLGDPTTAAAVQLWAWGAAPVFSTLSFLPPSPGATFVVSSGNPGESQTLWTSVYNGSTDGALLIRMLLSGSGATFVHPFAFETPGETFVAASVFSGEGFRSDVDQHSSSSANTGEAVFVVTATADANGIVVYDAMLGSVFSAGNVYAGVSFGAVASYSNQGTGYALVGVTTASREAAVVLFAARGFDLNELERLSPPERALNSPPSNCVDSSQPAVCYQSCSPLPSVICGPAVPAPAGYLCFLLPTQPDACNTCPVEYEAQCPFS